MGDATRRPATAHLAALALLALAAVFGGRPARGLAGEPAPRVLFDPHAPDAICSVQGLRAQVSVEATAEGKVLRVAPEPAGGEGGAVLAPLDEAWDLSQFDSLAIRVRNAAARDLSVRARAENPESRGYQDSCRGMIVLRAGESGALRVKLARRPEDPGYAVFEPFNRYSKSINVRDNTVDPAQISRVVIYLDEPQVGDSFLVHGVSAEGTGVPAAVPFFPFVDSFGQYRHTDWPGKIHSEGDLAARREEERAEAARWPGPPDWDQYGGWADGPSFEATGFFHPVKHEGKWWLVDPEGKLFWSYGPTGVGFWGDPTPITDRERWFEGLPDKASPLGRFYGRGRGASAKYYGDKDYETFDFVRANLHRKYGPDFQQVVAELSHRRLRNWGFNTIAMWSTLEVYLKRKTPYAVAIHYGGPWLDRIPDAFDPRFRETVRARLEQERETTANDPWNIGYFVDNELWWGHMPKASLVAIGALTAGPEAAGKQEFVGDLQARYAAIAALNESWGTHYESWEALLESREPPSLERAGVLEDCGAFGLRFAERYFATVREEVKRVAPSNLYLGCRFHGHIDLPVIEVAARYCDVISYNVYDAAPGARLDRYVGVVDKPFIVGEFGVSSDPARTPFRGDDLSPDPRAEQEARLATYVEAALRHPLLVGAHFFQYWDQPVSGRPDGEAVLRGFVSITDTPNLPLLRTNRRLAEGMYGRRAGVADPAPAGAASLGR